MDRYNFLRLKGIITDKVFTGPERLELEINTLCNLNCSFCWFHSPLVNQKLKNWELELKKYKEIIDDAKEIGVKHIYITGRGEPGLHPALPEMIKYAKDKLLYTSITTNLAYNNKKVIRSLAEADLIEITFSSYSKEHYGKMQSPKNPSLFDIVIRNIRILNKISALKKKPKIIINYILTQENYKTLDKFIALANNIGIKEIRLSPFSDIAATKKLYLPKSQIKSLGPTIKKLSKENGIILDYDWSKLNDLRIKNCYMGWYTMLVGTFGKVKVGCFDSLPKKEGDIYKNSLKEIWGSSKAMKIRLLLKHNLNKALQRPANASKNCCPYAILNKKIDDIIKSGNALKQNINLSL